MIAASSMSVQIGRCLLLACILGAVAGCGDGRPPRVPVSGMVMIDGRPLTRGHVKFVPDGGRPSVGKIGEDGKFALTCYDGTDGAILGTHRVQVAASRVISDNQIEWFAPRSYADFRTSGIQVDIEEPTSDLKIELTWGNRKGPYIESL